MRKRFTFLLALCSLAGYALAQQPMGMLPLPSGNEQVSAAQPATYAPVTPMGGNPIALGPGCSNGDILSSATNMFSVLSNNVHVIASNNATNTIAFGHRNNSSVFGGHSGQLRYDWSTNRGVSWTSNLGVLNPASVNGTNAARYPNVAIYNPANNTVPTESFLCYQAATVAATWNGYVSGVRKMNGTGNTETYNQPTLTQTLIPRSLVNGAPGVMWSVDAVFNGTNTTGYRILKGVWNGSTDFVWSVNTTITPNFDLTYDGLPKNSSFSLAFDPSGNVGWMVFLGHIVSTPVAPAAFYPIFYKTTNGGTTWSGPTQVNLNQFPCLSSKIDPGNTATTAFEIDLSVDVNGNPHALFTFGNGNFTYSIFPALYHGMVHLTVENGLWSPTIISDAFRFRGTWGPTNGTASQDMAEQTSRSADGSKVFFFWTDADSSSPDPALLPDLYGAAYNVLTHNWTPVKNFTQCNPTYSGKALWPHAAPTALDITGGTEIPFVLGSFTTPALDPNLAANFVYLDSVHFDNSEFTIPRCTQPVSLAASDTLVICATVTLQAGAGQAYIWNTGATTSSISVSNSGWYKVSVVNNCCFGMDSVYVLFGNTPQAAFNVSGTFLTRNFSDLSTGSPVQWSWNFGDGNSSTLQNPQHTYAAPGTYQVCLTAVNACTTSVTCQTITVGCLPATPQFSYTTSGNTANFSNLTSGTLSSVTWAFGDGSFSNLSNPSHTYTAPGSYTVCLIITDACGSDTTCQTLAVGCNLPVASFSASNTSGLIYAFNNTSTGTPTTYLWDFGDGGLSSNANPSHAYSQSGTYQVCLTATNTCGTDSTCITLVVCIAPVANFNITAGTGPTFGFLDASTGNPTSWFWDFGDGNFSTAQNPSNVYATAGIYNVCLTVVNSCDSSTSCAQVNSVVGGASDALGTPITLYPNPASEMVSVVADELAAGSVNIRLHNVLGQSLFSINLQHNGGRLAQQIATANLVSGVYFVQIETEGRHSTQKLVIR